MTRRKIPNFEPGAIQWATLMELAIDRYKEVFEKEGIASLKGVAGEYGVAWTSLRDRINNGAVSREFYAKARQRLTPAEEKVLEEYCLQLEKWGCPARVNQLRLMAQELLKAKGDTRPLGKNWPSAFLDRHPNIKSVFTTPQDRNRQLSEDWDIISHWFQLYEETIKKYTIQPEDTYNMDEKGVALGQGLKTRCIVSKSEKRPKSSQDGSREWATLVEAISLTGKVLSPWIIFKGIINKTSWTEKLKALRKAQGEEFVGHICVSPNGWTDSELGIEWLKKCFEPETSKDQKGEYRLLLWDGHSSHISTSAIRYCLDNKIIPLCLPPHTTHLLQPCDVGLFGPEAVLYKNQIMRQSRPGASGDVSKETFLEVYCYIRPLALNQHNIEQAWRKSGLLPLDPNVVLSQLKRSKPRELEESKPLIEPPIEAQIEAQIEAEVEQALTSNTSNSRPSTAYGVPPLLDLKTPDIQVVLPLRMTFKTPSNITELEKLRELFKQSQINQSLLFEKAIKAAQYGLAKSVVAEATNQDLVDAADEARKKRNKVSGKNGKARVLDKDAYTELLQLEFDSWWTAPIYGKPIVKPENSSIIYNLGFSKIGADIFTWEITSQRKKKARIQPRTPSNQAVIRTPVRPKKQAIQPQVRSPQTPLIPQSLPLLRSPQQSLKPIPIRLPLRSIPRSRTPQFLDGQIPHKRRQHKVMVRRAQETQVTEVITHVTRGGRPVRQRRVEYI